MKTKRILTKFDDFIAESIENQYNKIYESVYSEPLIHSIVKNYVLIDYQLTVKDDMVTIELLKSPSKDAYFDEKMWSKDLVLIKINEEGSVANYKVQKTDLKEKTDFEKELITLWLTTQKDDHEDWDWDGKKLELFNKDLEVIKNYTREELSNVIKSFPKS